MSSFGRLFRVATFGESHGGAVGCIVEGIPSRMPLTEADIQPQLDRRRPGQTKLTTQVSLPAPPAGKLRLPMFQRNEEDKVTILSGTEHGTTLGSPICLIVANRDQKPHDYSSMSQVGCPVRNFFLTYVRTSHLTGKFEDPKALARGLHVHSEVWDKIFQWRWSFIC